MFHRAVLDKSVIASRAMSSSLLRSSITSEISHQRSFLHPHCLLGLSSLLLLLAAHFFPAFATHYRHHHHHHHRGFATDVLASEDAVPFDSDADDDGENNDATAGAETTSGLDAIFERGLDADEARILVRLRDSRRVDPDENEDYDDGDENDERDDDDDDDFVPSLTLNGVFAPGGVVDSVEGEICFDAEVRGAAGSSLEKSAETAELDTNHSGGAVRAEDGANDAADVVSEDRDVGDDASGADESAENVVGGRGGVRGDSSTDEKTSPRKRWIALLQWPKFSTMKYGGTSFLRDVHRAMVLGASAVLVLASFSHPQRLLHRIAGESSSSSPISLFKRPIVILRAAEFNVSLLVQALASRLKASVKITPRRGDGPSESSSPSSSGFSSTASPSDKSMEQTTPTVAAGGADSRSGGVFGGGGGGVTFWGRCGRFSEWQGVVCLDERLETTTTIATACRETCSDADGHSSSASSSSSPSSSTSRTMTGANHSSNGFHLWNVLYSASISLCLFLLLKVVGSSASLTMMLSTRRSADDEMLLPPIVGEKDVEISLRRLARDALRAMPITRYQIIPKRNPDSEPRMCPICLSNFTWNQKIRLLPCLHEFHTRCADPWLVDHRTCPLCKLNIVRHWALTQI